MKKKLVRDLSPLSKSTKKIGLLGPWGTGNLGDAAIQQAMICHIRKYYPDAQIYGFSLCPEDTEKRHDIPSFPMGALCTNVTTNTVWLTGNGKNLITMALFQIYAKVYSMPDRYRFIRKLLKIFPRSLLEIFSWFRAYQNLKGFDFLIVSGGGQLDDYYGGPWRGQPFTLFMWGLFAKIHRVEYWIVSVGAGPLDAGLSKLFIRWTLMLASYRSYRDEDSKKFIEEVVGFQREDPVYPDLAYSLETRTHEYPHNFNELHTLSSHRLIVGIGLIPCIAPEGQQDSQHPLQVEYLNKLASFTSWLFKQNCAILFITGEAGGDREIINDFRKVLDEAGVVYSENQIIENPIDTTDDLMLQLSMTDIVLTSRFHGVLLSHFLSKPVLALSYHNKIDMLMAEAGQTRYCLPVHQFDVDTLKECFTELEVNYKAIKEHFAQRTARYQTALDEQYERLFASS